jgi:four helix bundle protein
MGVPTRDHRDLRAYIIAFDAAMTIFGRSREWPREERYALTDQILRSSRSVCGNIAEAWQKRRYPAHFVSKLTDACAESEETGVWLEFACRCGYLNADEHQSLTDSYRQVGRLLTRMAAVPDQWCRSTKPIR